MTRFKEILRPIAALFALLLFAAAIPIGTASASVNIAAPLAVATMMHRAQPPLADNLGADDVLTNLTDAAAIDIAVQPIDADTYDAKLDPGRVPISGTTLDNFYGNSAHDAGIGFTHNSTNSAVLTAGDDGSNNASTTGFTTNTVGALAEPATGLDLAAGSTTLNLNPASAGGLTASDGDGAQQHTNSTGAGGLTYHAGPDAVDTATLDSNAAGATSS